MSLALITDSTVCLPQELIKGFSIDIVPVSLVLDGRVYRDGVDITSEEFYDLLKQANHLPTTSPSSPGGYLEAFRQASRWAKDILCITISRRVSAMFDSARAAAEMARGIMPQTRIEVVDSGTAGMAQGFLVLEAGRAAQAGKSLDEVMALIQLLKPRLNFLAMLDTLSYLAKGGRVPMAAAWATSLLQVKPILQIQQGEISLLEHPRTRRKGMERLVALMKARVGTTPVHAAVVHAACPDDAQELRARVSAGFSCRQLYVAEFTPVMGTHTGPGLLGLAFYAEEQAKEAHLAI